MGRLYKIIGCDKIPYTLDNPPEFISDLPKAAQKIWISTYTEAKVQYEGDETTAIRVAWAAVNKQYTKDEDGKWTKIQTNMRWNDSRFLRDKHQKIIPVYQDEYFKGYDTILTRTAVMNRALKPKEEVRKIVDNLPEKFKTSFLPTVIDHPPFPRIEIYESEKLAGFVNNIKLIDDDKEPYIMGTTYIPKTENKLIEDIESGKIKGTSIGYEVDSEIEAGTFFNSKGEGYYYDEIEYNIRIHHNAILYTEEPACAPPHCGINEEMKVQDLDNDELLAQWNRVVGKDRSPPSAPQPPSPPPPQNNEAETKQNELIDLELKKKKIEVMNIILKNEG